MRTSLHDVFSTTSRKPFRFCQSLLLLGLQFICVKLPGGGGGLFGGIAVALQKLFLILVLCGTPALHRRDGYLYTKNIKRGVSGRPLYFPLPRAGEMGYYVGWARKVAKRKGGARDVW